MSSISTAQSIVDEFFPQPKEVIVVTNVEPLSVRITFRDGTERKINGKLATEIKKAMREEL